MAGHETPQGILPYPGRVDLAPAGCHDRHAERVASAERRVGLDIDPNNLERDLERETRQRPEDLRAEPAVDRLVEEDTPRRSPLRAPETERQRAPEVPVQPQLPAPTASPSQRMLRGPR